MNWKKIGKKLLFPPFWVIALLTPLCTVALIAVFVKGWDAHSVAYAVYALSAYTVTVLTLFCIFTFPGWYKSLKIKIYSNPIGNRYMTDAAFRIKISLYSSLFINMVYVALNLLSGYIYRSVWFIVLAVYYAIFSSMRFILLRYVRRNVIGEDLLKELKRSRACAVILMSLNLVLSGAVLMIMYQGKGYEYKGVLIFAMAAYTFYITVIAVRNLLKYRKYHSPVMSTAKVISLAAALVSMLSLETAMLTQFGAGESETFRRIMIAATGGGISIIVVTLSLYIIIKNTREIKALKEKSATGE